MNTYKKYLLISLVFVVVAFLGYCGIYQTNTDGAKASVFSVFDTFLKSEKTSAAVSPSITFPADHAQHITFDGEWWYVNLLTRSTKLDGSSSQDLAHIISFSRINDMNGLLTTRFSRSDTSFRETTHTGGTVSGSLKDNQYMLVKYANQTIRMTLEELPPDSSKRKSYHLSGTTPEIGSFDLVLREHNTPPPGGTIPLLWGGTTYAGCKGQISVFAPNDTYYYSIPDLDVSGTIIDTDRTKRVVHNGKAWIDHQWFAGMPSLSWKGHYWTSFHYAPSTQNFYSAKQHEAVGFVSQIYANGPKYTYWVKRNAEGLNECGTEGTINVTGYGSSGYPESWILNLLNDGAPFLNMTGETVSDNQIIVPPIGPAFVEAFSDYAGISRNNAVEGIGFFETHRIGQ